MKGWWSYMADRTQDIGIFSAYGFAREGGYTGTKAEFEDGLAKSANYANNAQASATAAANSATSAHNDAESASDSASSASSSADSAAASAEIAQALSQTLYMDTDGLFYITIE